MAALAMNRDDVAGATVTTGAAQAYSLGTFSNFTSAAALANQLVAFTPHVTNGAGPVTITIDSVPNIPLRTAPGVELLAGTIIAGTPYCCCYNNTDGALYLQGFYGQPLSVPFLGGMDFWDTITPNSSFIFPAGQAISRVTYAQAFARWGTTYGVGDGSTTFNVPDKTERVSVMVAASATRLPSAYFGGNSAAMGAVGGGPSVTMAAANLIQHLHANTLTDPGHSHSVAGGVTEGSNTPTVQLEANASTIVPGAVQAATTGITITNVNAGSASPTPMAIVQPTIVCNYIIRIL